MSSKRYCFFIRFARCQHGNKVNVTFDAVRLTTTRFCVCIWEKSRGTLRVACWFCTPWCATMRLFRVVFSDKQLLLLLLSVDMCTPASQERLWIVLRLIHTQRYFHQISVTLSSLSILSYRKLTIFQHGMLNEWNCNHVFGRLDSSYIVDKAASIGQT
jgi:hypothetical protein